MDRRHSRLWICLLIASLIVSGCQPTQPFFYNEDGDLSHYLDMATQVEFPDLESCPLPDAQDTQEPLSVINADPGQAWDLTLEEAISISLNNSKVIRSIAQVRQSRQVGTGVSGPPENLLINSEFSRTIYDAAIEESGPNGVETALSAFDAQLSTNLFWERTDRPQNVDDDVDPHSDLRPHPGTRRHELPGGRDEAIRYGNSVVVSQRQHLRFFQPAAESVDQ